MQVALEHGWNFFLFAYEQIDKAIGDWVDESGIQSYVACWFALLIPLALLLFDIHDKGFDNAVIIKYVIRPVRFILGFACMVIPCMLWHEHIYLIMALLLFCGSVLYSIMVYGAYRWLVGSQSGNQQQFRNQVRFAYLDMISRNFDSAYEIWSRILDSLDRDPFTEPSDIVKHLINVAKYGTIPVLRLLNDKFRSLPTSTYKTILSGLLPLLKSYEKLDWRIHTKGEVAMADHILDKLLEGSKKDGSASGPVFFLLGLECDLKSENGQVLYIKHARTIFNKFDTVQDAQIYASNLRRGWAGRNLDSWPSFVVGEFFEQLLLNIGFDGPKTNQEARMATGIAKGLLPDTDLWALGELDKYARIWDWLACESDPEIPADIKTLREWDIKLMNTRPYFEKSLLDQFPSELRRNETLRIAGKVWNGLYDDVDELENSISLLEEIITMGSSNKDELQYICDLLKHQSKELLPCMENDD
ncbi:hypothetical protein OZX62_04035 [Bifidobacterium sp. ESL0690]|uniref:hypothetical protein n=1 Tax=Bifidobacterium sp. ESL0690 TaxID=2983214 RepID=UPI0023F90C25|nr:hypothetical protein [Bifidobacterium sp. ESL0690]WEV47444.1 hypothetical protein OZX62_04035 [Bifidobacterium sp. ESL0690]